MSRRNPMNERYGKHTAPDGKTRRSAASAKPKRAEATGAGRKKSPASRRLSAAKGAPVKSAAGKKRVLIVHPDTVEYRRWRRIWWVLLILPLGITLIAWYPLKEGNRTLAYGMLGLAYACMAGAIYIDWSKLRKLREKWAEQGGAQKKQEKGSQG